MATLANLNVLIGSDVSGLTRGLRTADKKTRGFSNAGSRYMQQFAKGTGGAVRKVVNLRSAIGVLAGSAGLGLLVAKQLQSIDSTAKFADMIGESTKELVGLQHAAEITAGVTSNQFNMALQRMTRRLAEAAAGTGEAKDTIKELGLDAQELSRMGPAAAFQQISAAMQQVDNQGQRVRYAFKLFDSEGAKLVNTLNAGPEAIRELVSEADRLGKSFTRIDAAKVEAANDAITRAQGAFSGVARTLTVELAPYIEAVANEFVNASKQSNGFRDVVIGAVEGAAKAVGFLGDMFRGIRVVIKTVEVGFAMFAEGMYHSVLEIVNGLRVMANAIPGIDIGPLDGLKSVAQSATIRTNELKGELDDLVSEPMPGEKIDAFFKNVKAGAKEAAVAVAESKRSMASTVIDPQGQPANDEDRTKLERMRESFLSEQELRQEQFQQKREFLLNANSQLFDDEAERKRMLEQLESDHLEKLKKIRKNKLSDLEKFNQANWQSQTKTVVGELSQMTAGVAQHSKTMFKINKTAGIANAIINTAQGVTKALTQYPPPLSFAMAAAQAAAGFAQVSAIKSQSFNGGGSGAAPSVAAAGGGSQTVNTIQAQGQPEQEESQGSGGVTNITVEGDSVGGEALDNMIDKFREAMERNDEVIFTRNSRQARELRA